MKYLFLDTNVYLHYNDFEQIVWKSLLRDDVTIAVPYKVIGEIDKKKDQDRGKIQKRAKKVSSRLSEIFLQCDTSSIPVVEVDDAPSFVFDNNNLMHEIADDCIIASALNANYDNSDIVIVSGDNGILMKAKRRGLGFYKMPDSLLLSEELSEEEKQIKRLKQDLFKYENRRPDPLIEFDNETIFLTITKPKFINVQAELQEYEKELKGTYEYQSLDDKPVDGISLAIQSINELTYSTLGQREEYNKELDCFFEKKLKLKEFQLGSKMMEQRFTKLSFWLANDGTSALGNTTIFITFPKDVMIYSNKSKARVKLEDPPVPILKNNLSVYNESLMNYLSWKNIHHEYVDIWNPRKNLDKHEFKFYSSNLTHGLHHLLDGKEDIYIDIAQCGNFTIKWRVIDSELIESVEGELHVIIKDTESSDARFQ